MSDSIVIENLTKYYGKFLALDNLSNKSAEKGKYRLIGPERRRQEHDAENPLWVDTAEFRQGLCAGYRCGRPAGSSLEQYRGNHRDAGILFLLTPEDT